MDTLEVALAIGIVVFLLAILAGMIGGVFEEDKTALSTIQSRGHRKADEPTSIIQPELKHRAGRNLVGIQS